MFISLKNGNTIVLFNAHVFLEIKKMKNAVVFKFGHYPGSEEIAMGFELIENIDLELFTIFKRFCNDVNASHILEKTEDAIRFKSEYGSPKSYILHNDKRIFWLFKNGFSSVIAKSADSKDLKAFFRLFKSLHTIACVETIDYPDDVQPLNMPDADTEREIINKLVFDKLQDKYSYGDF